MNETLIIIALVVSLIFNALSIVLALYAQTRYTMARRLLHRVVGRSLTALKRRGVHKKKAVELVCPELRKDLLVKIKPTEP